MEATKANKLVPTNKLVLPITVRSDETLNLMKAFVKIMSIVYKTQPRENEILYLMLVEFNKVYSTSKDLDLTYEMINSTKIRRIICEQMGLSLGVYRTMLNKLRNNYVLKNDNRFPNLIEAFAINFTKDNKYSIEFILNYGS